MLAIRLCIDIGLQQTTPSAHRATTMNLQTHIPAPLWDAILGPYESKNYSHAILEATHYISALLREKAGVDGDGAGLVGQALGGETPKLRINSLQTESEKNAQKGIEQILRGIYTGIRNPRSHDQIEDSKDQADAVIHFLGYLVGILSASKDTFTVAGFLEKVMDSEFYPSVRYSELIVEEIPALRRGEALISLFKERKAIDFRKLRLVIAELLRSASPGQMAAYLSIVSEVFGSTADDLEIRTALQMLSPAIWSGIQERPRLRIENKLISGIRDGEMASSGRTTNAQALSTWSNIFLPSFTLKDEAADALLSRLEGNAADRHYATRYFFGQLPYIIETKYGILRAARALAAAVESDDEVVRRMLISSAAEFPEEWQKRLAHILKGHTDPQNPGVVFPDGTPFLSAPAKDEMDDDIPF